MKNSFRALALGGLMMFGVHNAQAGVGLSLAGIYALSYGDFIHGSVFTGLGVGSIATGVHRMQNGRYGWGTFFLVLEEQNIVLSEQDKEILSSQDVSLIHTISEVMSDKEMSEEDKKEVLSEILGQ
jgi:hypothetical protein